jgi:hypothetical protein
VSCLKLFFGAIIVIEFGREFVSSLRTPSPEEAHADLVV